jgi:hypothetical protein
VNIGDEERAFVGPVRRAFGEQLKRDVLRRRREVEGGSRSALFRVAGFGLFADNRLAQFSGFDVRGKCSSVFRVAQPRSDPENLHT